MESSPSDMYEASTVSPKPHGGGGASASTSYQLHRQSGVEEEMSTLTDSAGFQRGGVHQRYGALSHHQGDGTPHASFRGGPPSEIHTHTPGTHLGSETSSFSHGSAMTASARGTNPSGQLVTPRDGASVSSATHHGLQCTPAGLSAASISQFMQGMQGRPHGVARRSARVPIDFLPQKRIGKNGISFQYAYDRWEYANLVFKDLPKGKPSEDHVRIYQDHLVDMYDFAAGKCEDRLLEHLQMLQEKHHVVTARGDKSSCKQIEQIHWAVLKNLNNLERTEYMKQVLEFMKLPTKQETKWLQHAINDVRDRYDIEFEFDLKKKNCVEAIATHKFNNTHFQRMRRGMFEAHQAVWYAREPSNASKATIFGENALTKSEESELWIGRHKLRGKMVELVGEAPPDATKEAATGMKGAADAPTMGSTTTTEDQTESFATKNSSASPTRRTEMAAVAAEMTDATKGAASGTTEAADAPTRSTLTTDDQAESLAAKKLSASLARGTRMATVPAETAKMNDVPSPSQDLIGEDGSISFVDDDNISVPNHENMSVHNFDWNGPVYNAQESASRGKMFGAQALLLLQDRHQQHCHPQFQHQGTLQQQQQQALLQEKDKQLGHQQHPELSLTEQRPEEEGLRQVLDQQHRHQQQYKQQKLLQKQEHQKAQQRVLLQRREQEELHRQHLQQEQQKQMEQQQRQQAQQPQDSDRWQQQQCLHQQQEQQKLLQQQQHQKGQQRKQQQLWEQEGLQRQHLHQEQQKQMDQQRGQQEQQPQVWDRKRQQQQERQRKEYHQQQRWGQQEQQRRSQQEEGHNQQFQQRKREQEEFVKKMSNINGGHEAGNKQVALTNKARDRPKENADNERTCGGNGNNEKAEVVEDMTKDQESSEHIVEKIVDVREKRGKITVRIRWKGCNEKQDTWEPRENLNEGAWEEAMELMNTRKSKKAKNKKRQNEKRKSNATVKKKKAKVNAKAGDLKEANNNTISKTMEANPKGRVEAQADVTNKGEKNWQDCSFNESNVIPFRLGDYIAVCQRTKYATGECQYALCRLCHVKKGAASDRRARSNPGAGNGAAAAGGQDPTTVCCHRCADLKIEYDPWWCKVEVREGEKRQKHEEERKYRPTGCVECEGMFKWE